MANFPPLKKYLIHCIDRLVEGHGLAGPFLDAGCGSGDVSAHLARKGWSGMAIDASDEALERARTLLGGHAGVRLEKRSLFEQEGSFQTLLALDVIEHLEDDAAALRRFAKLLLPGGHLILSVPSNPREWRWDDEGFGHYRRYTESELRAKLSAAGFKPLEIWDFTFPVFWLMRRLYTRVKRPPPLEGDKAERTRRSSGANPWAIPLVSDLLGRDNPIWRALYAWQFARFRTRVDSGHEMVALARREA